MREEELRAHHQSTLLQLREKALKERTQAELEWLTLKKQQLRSKGADDLMPPLVSREQGLLKKLHHEQVGRLYAPCVCLLCVQCMYKCMYIQCMYKCMYIQCMYKCMYIQCMCTNICLSRVLVLGFICRLKSPLQGIMELIVQVAYPLAPAFNTFSPPLAVMNV